MAQGTIEKFLDSVAAAMDRIGNEKSTEVFFRGQAQREWPLETTLQRFVRKLQGKDVQEDEIDLHEVESALYWEFRSKAIGLHREAKTGWDYLFWARHHGVPTRLMDWTENLFVALYFTLADVPSLVKNPRLWLLNPYRLNAIAMGSAELFHPQFISEYDYDEMIDSEDAWEWDYPVALYPEQTSPRQHAQQGWFTIQGNHIDSLEVQQEKLIRAALRIPLKKAYSMDALTAAQLENLASKHLPFLEYIDLSAKEVTALTRLLKLSGHSRFSIYQDLDSLAKDTVGRLEN